MMRKDDEMDERLMSDEAVEEAVLRYLEESPEVVSGIAPSRDLWPGIEARIGARVLPLGRDSGRDTVEVRSIRRRPPWLAMAAAAAVLVASTASVTYVLTKRAASPAQVATTSPAVTTPNAPSAQSAQVAMQSTTAPAAPTSDVASSAPQPQMASAAGTEHTPSATHKEDEARERTYATQHVTSRGAGASLVNYPATGSDEARVTYDDEIGRLHAVLESRRDQLDPSTVATVEQNLHVIDVAIEQARAALAKDPHSRMLNEQLDRTLAKKTQLLRAATLLPSV